MITPEPRLGVDVGADADGLWFTGSASLPAAGHLGVIEERCTGPHGDEDRPGSDRLKAVGGWKCQHCKATV